VPDNQQQAAEQLALVLINHGLQRMTARTLATLLFTEQPTMTMAELAQRLQASSGAISGAIKMLTSVGLAERVPTSASRRDHYRLRDDAWAILFTNQNVVISAMQAAAEAGIAATGPDSVARQRLTRMQDFYAFLLSEIPAVLERWQQRSPS
jgi:DNA-binding MarR family transcriptional regulator